MRARTHFHVGFIGTTSSMQMREEERIEVREYTFVGSVYAFAAPRKATAAVSFCIGDAIRDLGEELGANLSAVGRTCTCATNLLGSSFFYTAHRTKKASV